MSSFAMLLVASSLSVHPGQCGAVSSEVARCAPASPVVSIGAVAEKDIVETAVAAGSFNTLAAALKAAGLVDALKGEGPFTVFAPTDAAFAKLPAGTVESLLKPENKEKLVAILTYHVVKGAVASDKVSTMAFADTLNGQRIEIAAKDGRVKVDGATVAKADIEASNGIIHVVDQVLLPVQESVVEVAVENGFSTLAAAIKAADLVDALSAKGPFTVFAPTDSAFAKLPPGTLEELLKPENKERLRAVLMAHVVSGRVFSDAAAKLDSAKTLQGATVPLKVVDGGLRVDRATVVAADVEARNGVIHVIDDVILPK